VLSCFRRTRKRLLALLVGAALCHLLAVGPAAALNSRVPVIWDDVDGNLDGVGPVAGFVNYDTATEREYVRLVIHVTHGSPHGMYTVYLANGASHAERTASYPVARAVANVAGLWTDPIRIPRAGLQQWFGPDVEAFHLVITFSRYLAADRVYYAGPLYLGSHEN
jgi:hypothetical protein